MVQSMELSNNVQICGLMDVGTKQYKLVKTINFSNSRKLMLLYNQYNLGQLITIGNLRSKLAKDAGADMACPMTTGIFENCCICEG